MDDVRPSTESISPSGQTSGADEWETVRDLLSTQQALIVNLEAQVSANQAAAHADGEPRDAQRLAADAAHLTELMDDLVRRESALEIARQELTEAQRAGLRSSTSLAEERAALDQQRHEIDAERRRIAAETDHLTAERHGLDERMAVIDDARQELNAEKVELVRGQQQLAAERALMQVDRSELESRKAETTRERERLEAERQKLDADLDRLASDEAASRIAAERTKQQIARQTARYEEQRKQLETDRVTLAQERDDVKLAQEAAKACQAEFTRAHERLEAERTQLSLQRDRLVALEADTKNQRRRIAREFRVQHKTHLADIEARRDELESLVSATEGELRLLNEAVDEERRDELEISQDEERELRQRLSQLGKVLNARAEELRKLRTAVATLTRDRDQLAEQIELIRQHQTENAERGIDLAPTGDSEEATLLRIECDGLAKRLAAAELQLEAAGAGGDPMRCELQRRFEMAVQDLREQKERNVELECQLARLGTGGSSSGKAGAAANADSGDWESQKRMLLQSLEAEAQDEDGEYEAERTDVRLSIEATIRITDEVVAHKDREIAELRELLEQQAGSIGSVAIGATTIAGILDQDELIAQERARLAQVQAEWRDKLRQAEIDISVQRAAIARDRAQIDEKLANHQSDLDSMKDQSNAAGGKPHRRWLSRLGLKENEE